MSISSILQIFRDAKLTQMLFNFVLIIMSKTEKYQIIKSKRFERSNSIKIWHFVFLIINMPLNHFILFSWVFFWWIKVMLILRTISFILRIAFDWILSRGKSFFDLLWLYLKYIIFHGNMGLGMEGAWYFWPWLAFPASAGQWEEANDWEFYSIHLVAVPR